LTASLRLRYAVDEPAPGATVYLWHSLPPVLLRHFPQSFPTATSSLGAPQHLQNVRLHEQEAHRVIVAALCIPLEEADLSYHLLG
jgi:hypothetical protein